MAPVDVVGELYGDNRSGEGGGLGDLGGGDSILRFRVLWATGVGEGQLDSCKNYGSKGLRLRQCSGLRLENEWRVR